MKKYITELSREELEKVFEENDDLQTDVEDDMYDTNFDYVTDMLEPMKKGLDNWSIGANNYNYLKVGDRDVFIAGVQKSQADYGTLDDKGVVLLEQIILDLDKLNDLGADDNVTDEEYETASDEIDENIKDLASIIADYFTLVLEPSKNDGEEYFIDFYAEERLDEDCYIKVDDNSGFSDYILNQDIVYTKKYKKGIK